MATNKSTKKSTYSTYLSARRVLLEAIELRARDKENTTEEIESLSRALNTFAHAPPVGNSDV